MYSFNPLEIVGGIILLGFAVGRLFGVFRTPAVAGYVVLGVVLGDSFLGLISHRMLADLHVISDLALGAIAFTIGVELEWRTLRQIGRSVFPIVVFEALGAMILVTLGIWWFFGDLALALVLGAIAAATAPAATVMVIRESRSAGVLTSTLLAVVGIDDAIALILYAAAAAAAKTILTGHAAEIALSQVLSAAGYEIGGSLVLGVLVGVPLGWALLRIRAREAVLSLGVGCLILIEGLSASIHLSPLLAVMALGATAANIAPFPSRALGEQVANLAAPILIGFFVLAGAHLRADLLPALGWLGALYLIARFGGKLSGAWLGARLGGAPPQVRANIGFGLLSQVGIAIGLSLVVMAEFGPLGPEGNRLAVTVINVLLGTTLITEVVGPALTRRVLARAGEVGGMDRSGGSDDQDDARGQSA